MRTILRLAAALWLSLAAAAGAQSGLDLRNADLEGFVRVVAEETGRSYVLDPSVQGSVTVVAPEEVGRQDHRAAVEARGDSR